MIKRLLCFVLTALFVGVMCAGCGGPAVIYENEDQYTVGDGVIAQTVTKFDIDWIAGNVNIVYGTDNTLSLTETSPKSLTADTRLRWMVDGATLRVRYARSGLNISLGDLDKKLTLTLPAGFQADAFEIKLASADLESDPLTANSIQVTSASGDAELAVAYADTITVSASSGEVECVLYNTLPKVDISTASGEVTVKGPGIENLTVSTASGETDIDVVSLQNATIDSSSGDVTLKTDGLWKSRQITTSSGAISLFLPKNADFTLTWDKPNRRFESDFAFVQTGDVYVAGTGTSPLTVSTSSGKIEIMGVQ